MKLVSVLSPGGSARAGADRLACLPDAEVTLLTPNESPGGRAGTVRRIALQVQGRGRAAWYPSLSGALALLDPDVVHVQAEPDSAVALQVAGLCGRRSGRGFLLEVESGAAPGRSVISAWRARRSLRRAHALVARSGEAIAAVRRLGFRGAGIVASPGEAPETLPSRAEALRELHVADADLPVFGWAGSLGAKSGVWDALEAVAAIESEIVLIIAGGGPERHDALDLADAFDRADALEILHRVRFVAPAPDAAGRLAACPAMLAAADALLVAPPAAASAGADEWRSIALAQTHGIPVIYADLPGLAEAVGPGGWPVPPDDPALLSRLLGEIGADRSQLEAAGAAAAAHAAQRHTPAAAAARLAAAVRAALPGPGQVRMRPDASPMRDYLPRPAEREPSRT